MTSVTPEEYWAYKAFKRDDVTEEALRSSEIFMRYRAAEMQRENELKNINAELADANETEILNSVAEFQKKVKASPELLNKLKQVKAYLDANPEIISSVDQDFINGLNMLEL